MRNFLTVRNIDDESNRVYKIFLVKSTKQNSYLFEDEYGNKLRSHLSHHSPISLNSLVLGGIYMLDEVWVLVIDIN